MTTAPKSETIHVERIDTKTVEVCLMGVSPLYQHRMASKAMLELVAPKGRRTAADRAATPKHDLIAEFRDAAEVMDSGPTYLGIPATAFKGALMTAALDAPGPRKAQVGRLSYVEGDRVPVYGLPYLALDIVRNSDINHTPDVRARPILPRWCAVVRVTFVTPILNETSVVNLLQRAGVTCGVGDYRQEKGKGDFGRWRLARPDDPDFLHLVKSEGRDAQRAAMDEPVPHTREAAELLTRVAERNGAAAA